MTRRATPPPGARGKWAVVSGGQRLWEKCIECSGHGVVPVYTPDATDFEGAGECRVCHGSGRILARKKVVIEGVTDDG
jgi:DnaJ-class molecular chaperone